MLFCLLRTNSNPRFLDIFKFDPNYVENEEKYKSIKAEILGEDSDGEGEDTASDESSDDEDEGKSDHVCSTSHR